MELQIIYEDELLLAVDKPAGVVVHPTYKNVAGTLLDAVRAQAAGWSDTENPTIVGRLDKDTSGIVIVAKTRAAHAALQRSLALGEKDYYAVVRGQVDVERGTIDLALKVDPADRRRVIVSPDDGSPSVTQFERLASAGGLSVLRCRLLSGRRHQIRVHLAARGWPVVGDAVYGEAVEGFPRHALHAWRLSVVHPGSGDRLVIEAPIPAALQRLVTAPTSRA